MSLSATCFLVAILGQTAPAGNESAGPQLQFGPLQAPATATVPEQGGEGLKLADEADQPAPAALQAPVDAPYRSIYGSGTQPAADSAPSLGPPVSGLKSSAPSSFRRPPRRNCCFAKPSRMPNTVVFRELR